MALHEIDRYKAYWSISYNLGRVSVWKEGQEETWNFQVDSTGEFSLVIDLLRNEKPVYYDPEAEIIGGANEPVGEGEGS